MTQTDWREALSPYLPGHVNRILAAIPAQTPVEEIRLRAGQPLQVCFSGHDRLIFAPGGRAAVSEADCADTLRRICENSIYAWEEELRRGFITLPGGCRVGITGRAVVQQGGIARLTDVTGLAIRIARACPGVAEPLVPALLDAEGKLCSTLVVSAPGAGKTTLLRDLTRLASSGGPGLRPCRVSIVDTRYELAGSVRGAAHFDLGPRTDVLSGCARAEGIRLLLSAMSPELIVADELFLPADIAAVTEAAGSGVRVLAGAHSGSTGMLQKRRSLNGLLASGLFERFVVLSRRCGPGTVEGIFDAGLRRIASEELTCRKSLPS